MSLLAELLKKVNIHSIQVDIPPVRDVYVSISPLPLLSLSFPSLSLSPPLSLPLSPLLLLASPYLMVLSLIVAQRQNKLHSAHFIFWRSFWPFIKMPLSPWCGHWWHAWFHSFLLSQFGTLFFFLFIIITSIPFYLFILSYLPSFLKGTLSPAGTSKSSSASVLLSLASPLSSQPL